MSQIKGNLVVTGHFTADTMTIPSASVTNAAIAAGTGIERSKLAQDTIRPFTIPLTAFRQYDNMHLPLSGTSTREQLALVGGTHGTNPPTIQSWNVKLAASQTLYARVVWPLPMEYDDGETVQIRFSAGMITTVADASATLTIDARESGGDNTVGGTNLYTGAAQDMNSLTFADLDFALTETDLVSGDELDILVTMALNDAASATAVIGAIGKCTLMCDVKG